MNIEAMAQPIPLPKFSAIPITTSRPIMILTIGMKNKINHQPGLPASLQSKYTL